MHNDNNDIPEEHEWSDLDQVSTRKSIREIIRDDIPNDFGEQVVALQQLSTIVKEEMADALAPGLNTLLAIHPAHTREQATDLTATIESSLASLGLALEDPATHAPVSLTVAPTPPQREGQSWLLMEPLLKGAGQTPKRLTGSLPKFGLVTEPARDLYQDRSRSR